MLGLLRDPGKATIMGLAASCAKENRLMLSHNLVFSQPLRAEWVERELPEPGPGEVLIRTHKTLISTGTELTAYTGDFPPGSVWSGVVQYPWHPGYCNVGEVVEVGPGVVVYKPGQRVASWGPHATYALQPLSQVQAIPDGVTDDQAVFWNLGKTVMNGVRLARIALGEAVVLVGVGILGQLATQYAALSGAWPLVVVDLSELRLEMARKHGATHALLGGRDELLAQVREITRGRMADVAFEITGNQRVIPMVVRLVRRLGRVVLLGSPRGKVELDFHDEVHTLGLQIIGAHVSTHPEVETPYNPWTPERNGELFFDLVMAGKLQVAELITHRLPWRDAPAAYERLATDRTKVMGVVLEGWTD
jgi:2-desacetyl-2-hydroxyethyl bacteriochlorophyllide A dehydrogenase